MPSTLAHSRCAAVLTAIGICLAGCGKGDETVDSREEPVGSDSYSGCAAPCFAEVPTEGVVLYVAECQSDGDGTRQSPFLSLADTVANAPEGATIMVSNGVFPVELVVDKPLTVVGCSPDETVLRADGEGPAIRVQNTAGVILDGFSLRTETAHYALAVSDSQDVHLRNLQVSGSGLGASAAGIVVKGSQDVTIGSMERDLAPGQAGGCAIRNVAGIGLFAEASQVRVIGNLVEGARAGGIYLADVGGDGQAALIANNELTGEAAFGIVVGGGNVVLSGNLIQIEEPQDPELTPRCISVSDSENSSAKIEITANTLVDCPSIGVLLSDAQGATVADNAVLRPGFGGIYLQWDASATVTGNTIDASGLAGIVLSDGTSADLVSNTIVGVEEMTVVSLKYGTAIPWAFGIAVTGPRPAGAVFMEGNQVAEAKFAGILVSESNEEQVVFGSGNAVAGNLEAGIALESGAESIAAAQALETLISFSIPELGLEGNGPTGSENVVAGTTYLVE